MLSLDNFQKMVLKAYKNNKSVYAEKLSGCIVKSLKENKEFMALVKKIRTIK